MTIRDSLVLDHFYINASNEDFDALLKMKDFIQNGFRHSVVKTDNDQWEGIYLRSRAGSYFEILRNRRPNSLGLAFQTFDPMSLDASEIMSELPLDWNVFSRSFPDGQNWFDSISTMEDPASLGNYFSPWIMKYYIRKAKPQAVIAPRSIDRFPSIEMTLGRAHLEHVRSLSEWFPGVREFNADFIHFQYPDRDGWSFDVRIHLVDGDQRFEFKTAVIEMYEAFPDFKPLKLGSFVLSRSERSLVLAR